MMIDAAHFFSEEEQQRIADTIAQVERHTAGEIRVMVVDESDTYPEALILGGVCLGGLLALVISDRFLHDSLWLFIPTFAVAALLGGLLLRRLPLLHRIFISPAQANRRVEANGALAFFAKGLHRTRDESGVLFFLSLLERKVWVLAGSGIYQKISQEELQTFTRAIVAGIKDDRKTEALCAEIVRCGELLAQHFPIRPDDRDELPNTVIVESRRKPTT